MRAAAWPSPSSRRPAGRRLPALPAPPQVSDLTGSFRLFRKPCLEEVMALCTSKG